MASSSPVKRTHIMYNVSMSYSQLMYYLQQLQEKKMLSMTSDGQYIATATGREYLRLYHKTQQIIGNAWTYLPYQQPIGDCKLSMPKFVCNGLCRWQDGMTQGFNNSLYKIGWKRRNTCNIFFQTRELRCFCCNQQLPFKSRLYRIGVKTASIRCWIVSLFPSNSIHLARDSICFVKGLIGFRNDVAPAFSALPRG